MGTKRQCHTPGCMTMTQAVGGYCGAHYKDARPCRIDGCTNRVRGNSYYGGCKKHYWLAVKMGPFRREHGNGPASESPTS